MKKSKVILLKEKKSAKFLETMKSKKQRLNRLVIKNIIMISNNFRIIYKH